MESNYFIERMRGEWIIQSTNYPLLNVDKSSCNFINRMRWHYIKNDKKYLYMFCKHNHINLLQKSQLYSLQLMSNKKNKNHYIVLITDKLNQSFLLKFDMSFNLINKFFIEKIDKNFLHLSTYINKFEVLQKIYFLNNNVKLIKVTIKKGSYYVGTFFTSEIRVS